ncbi:MAG TPA: DoxX family protein [Burkholderiales bacterium]|nr:DoxX family protein [Burkholderiales bacterium]
MTDDVGKLVLRLTLGILMLLHGSAKITTGVERIGGMLEGVGLPAFFAYGVYVGEILAPLLVIIGFYARIGALLMVVNMLFAIGLVHMKDIFVLTRTGGWGIELQAFFLFSAVSIALMGPGRFAVNRK